MCRTHSRLGCMSDQPSRAIEVPGIPNYADPQVGPSAKHLGRWSAVSHQLRWSPCADSVSCCAVLLQVLKEPKDVAQQRRDEEAAANAARRAVAFVKADERTKMKGKNKPTRRQKKKQMNIIEERKPALRTKLQQEVSRHNSRSCSVGRRCFELGQGIHAHDGCRPAKNCFFCILGACCCLAV